MEFAQRTNVRDFVGPFTTSCEAQTWIVSQRQANTVIGGRMWYCELENKIVSTRCRNWANSNIYVSLMWSQVSVSLLCQINFICMKNLKESDIYFHCILDDFFNRLSELVKTHLWLNVRLILIVFGPTDLLADKT